MWRKRLWYHTELGWTPQTLETIPEWYGDLLIGEHNMQGNRADAENRRHALMAQVRKQRG